jgi:hypothetical protein
MGKCEEAREKDRFIEAAAVTAGSSIERFALE